MNRITVLISGNNKALAESLQNDLQQRAGWEAIITFAAETAIEYLHRQPVNAIVLTSGPADPENRKLRVLTGYQEPDAIIHQYDGEDSTTLITAIEEKLAAKTKNSYTFNDDIFRGFHASL